jgi:hypothetical protein
VRTQIDEPGAGAQWHKKASAPARHAIQLRTACPEIDKAVLSLTAVREATYSASGRQFLCQLLQLDKSSPLVQTYHELCLGRSLALPHFHAAVVSGCWLYARGLSTLHGGSTTDKFVSWGDVADRGMKLHDFVVEEASESLKADCIRPGVPLNLEGATSSGSPRLGVLQELDRQQTEYEELLPERRC